MNKLTLQLAGWVAATSAVLTIPLFVFQVLAARAGPTFLSTVIQFINMALFLYVLSSLRRLLAQKGCESANLYLALIIVLTVILQIATLFVSREQTFLALLLLAALIALGISYIVAGIKLLACSDRLPGLKLISYSAIAIGTCCASVVLALLTLPASMLMDIALAIVFFNEADKTAPAVPASTIDPGH